MSIFFDNFHFLRPWWLFALAALPLLWMALAGRGSDGGAWRGVVDAHLLQYLLVRGDDVAPSKAPRRLAMAGWALACLALAGPAWEQLPQPLYQNRAARVIALELSSTMSAQDIKPSRFERARYKIADILKRSGDSQTALIAYAGEAFVVAPLTDDTNTVANLVDSLDPSVMPVPGNATGNAIDLAVKLIQGAGLHDGEIVLLADGVSGDADAAARRAHAAGMRVSIIGVGTTQGAPVPLVQGGFLKNSSGDIELPKLDNDTLASVARDGGGRYAPISTDPNDLDSVLDELAPHAIAQSQASAHQATTMRYRDRGPWLALLLLPLALAGFRRGWLMIVPLALCAHAQTASAFSWDDLWQRPDQQAQAQLDAGNAKQAQALAKSPALRGAADYRAGDMADAARDFQSVDNADARYNAGNALAKQQQFKEAIAAYDDALRRDPSMADAAENKKAVEEWLKKQQPKNQQGDKDKQDAKDHQGKDQKDDGSSGGKGDDQQKNQSDQSSSSADSEQDSKNNSQSQQGDQNAGDKKNQQSQSGSSGEQDDRGDDKDAQQQAGAKDADRQTQERYSQGMDQALKQGDDKDTPKNKPIRLGAANEREGAQNEEQQAVQQWLRRVPDDPGGLLRRKFLLEHQRRQSGQPQGDEGP